MFMLAFKFNFIIQNKENHVAENNTEQEIKPKTRF